MLIDTHCHIYKEYYDDIDNIMNKIINANVYKIINNACNLYSCNEIIDLSKKYENMYIALGLHPEENLNELDDIIKLIRSNINNKKMVAIGEIGLDYNFNKDNKVDQKRIFEHQLELAEELNIPVIIHSRDATEDTLNILKKHKLKGVIHCFNGSVEVAKEYIKLGYKLGINGVVTFKNCKLIDTIKQIGVNNLVFETDSPYLTPVPDRGKKNDPSYVNYIVGFLSKNLNMDKELLEEISNKNVKEIFDI